MAEISAPAKTGSLESYIGVGRSSLTPLAKRNAEDALFWAFVVVSLGLHGLVIAASTWKWLHDHPKLNTDEWSMDADVVTDLDLAPAKTALPQAEIKPEARAPVQLLPQLPQKFAVKEAAKPEDMVPLEKTAEPPPPPPPEIKPAVQEKKAEETHIKTDNKTDNAMPDAEIRKRAALDRLRAQEKTAKTAEAPEKDELARIAEALAQSPKGLTSGSPNGKNKANTYIAKLKVAIGRNYAVPEASQVKNSALKVVLLIRVSENGDLLDLAVKQPSGNSAFDDDTVRAVRASVPLPRPPSEFVGQSIAVTFSP